MSDFVETIKVKPWGNDQGEFVLVNKADFNPDIHEAFEEGAETEPAKTVAEVLAMADDAAVKFPTFRKEARKLLGDKLADDAKKAEIIEALKALVA